MLDTGPLDCGSFEPVDRGLTGYEYDFPHQALTEHDYEHEHALEREPHFPTSFANEVV